MAAAPARPSVSMVFPPRSSSSQCIVSPPGPSTSYFMTMASPTTSHPFISSEESLVSPLQFIQFMGMVKDSVRSFLEVSIDLEILVDLEAQLVVEVDVWEAEMEGMLHFTCCWFISSRSIKC